MFRRSVLATLIALTQIMFVVPETSAQGATGFAPFGSFSGGWFDTDWLAQTPGVVGLRYPRTRDTVPATMGAAIDERCSRDRRPPKAEVCASRSIIVTRAWHAGTLPPQGSVLAHIPAGSVGAGLTLPALICNARSVQSASPRDAKGDGKPPPCIEPGWSCHLHWLALPTQEWEICALRHPTSRRASSAGTTGG